ncbi:hypothetical protein EON65_14090 [archaeon]|nr:MAG: hypothetical protein EON65_14090 [archaeon]
MSSLSLSLSDLLASRRQGSESGPNSPQKRVVLDEAVEENKSFLARLPPRSFPAVALDEPNLSMSPKSKYVAHQSLLTEFDDIPVRVTQSASSNTANITKEKENLLKSSIDLSKQQMIEQLYVRIEELERLLNSERQYHEESVLATEKQIQLLLEEKDARYQELSQRYEQDVVHYRKQLHDKDQHYVKLISEQEKKHKDTMEHIRNENSLQIERMQAKVLQDQEWKSIAEQARLEAKGEDVRKEYEKKLRKMEKLVQQTMERYHDKDMKINGALEESRREIASLKEIIDKKDKAFQEHMSYQVSKAVIFLAYDKSYTHYVLIYHTGQADTAVSEVS